MHRNFENPFTATLAGLWDRRSVQRSVPALRAEERLDGQRVLITGANRGLGRAIAAQLAQRGARLVLACRTGLDQVATQVRQDSGLHDVEVDARFVDLSDLESVHALCDDLRADGVVLDGLVLNAGVIPAHARRTAQGFELQFGVNYLANVLLTQRLLEDGTLPNRAFGGVAAPGTRRPRIVMVSSETHRDAGPVRLADLGRYEHYGPMGGVKVYGYSKLLLASYAAELDRRLNAEGVDVAVHTTCPGAVNTDIAREAPELAKPLLRLVMGTFFRSPETAAEPIVYLCCARALEGASGKYLHLMNDKPLGAHALDAEVGRGLFEASQRLIARSGRPPAGAKP